MTDILETGDGRGATFRALTRRAIEWMSGYLGRHTEQIRYIDPEKAKEFRKLAVTAGLTISPTKTR